MALHRYTDEELATLQAMPKRVVSVAPWLGKRSHRQRTFEAEAVKNKALRFRIYRRKHSDDSRDFSCGIDLLHPRGSVRPLNLARYNGSNHSHGKISRQCHIHRATAASIAEGNPEKEAHHTDRYTTLDGALSCLVKDYNIQGL